MGVTPPTPPEPKPKLAEKLYNVWSAGQPAPERVVWEDATEATKTLWGDIAAASAAPLPPGPSA